MSTKIKRNLLTTQLNLYPPGARKVFTALTTEHGVRLTRKEAQELLDNNFQGQRGISQTHVQALASKMNAGEWSDTSQGLKIDWYGRLLDGQHRLMAFLESDLEELTITVTRGLDPRVFVHLDEDGKSRNLGDLLHSGQMPRSGMASNAFRILTSFDTLESREDRTTGYIAFGHRSSSRWKNQRTATATWILERAEKINNITAVLSSTDAKALLRPLGVFLGFYLWVSLDHASKADKFFELLISGENLSKSDPATAAIYHLRREILRLNKSREAHLGRTPDFMFGAIVIKAWNAWMKGEVPKKLVFNPETEEWPHRVGAKLVFPED